MKQDTEQEKQTPPAPKRGMSDFTKALLATMIPIIVLSAISTGGILAGADWEGLAVVALILWGLAILVAIGFAIARRGQIAAGILAGVGIGIVGVGLTCFVLLAGL